MVTATSEAMTWIATISMASAWVGLTFPGMIEGTKLNQAKLKENIDRSVMMVTALSPVIGYDKAAEISYYAIDRDLTL